MSDSTTSASNASSSSYVPRRNSYDPNRPLSSPTSTPDAAGASQTTRGRGGRGRGTTIRGGRGTFRGTFRGRGRGIRGGGRGTRGGSSYQRGGGGRRVAPANPNQPYDFASRSDATSDTKAAASVTGEEDYEHDGEGDYYEGDEGDYEGDEDTPSTSAATPAAATSEVKAPLITSRRPRILLGLTGSVATIKAQELVALLAKFADVQVIVTSSARHFLDAPNTATRPDAAPRALLNGTVPVLTDQEEYKQWKKMGDPVLHIDLRNWADLLVLAPLSANTLGKLANGLCDNLLTCVARAWDVSRPVIAAPAMNTHMWQHPLTARHISLLRKVLRWRILMPMVKRLACNEVGQGAMQSIWSVAAAARSALGLPVDPTLTTAIAEAEAKAAAGVAAANSEKAAATTTASSSSSTTTPAAATTTASNTTSTSTAPTVTTATTAAPRA